MKPIHKAVAFFKGLSKKQIVFSVIGLFIVGSIASAAFGGGGKDTFVVVTRGSIEEEVLVTGKSRSVSEVDLGFDRSGRVVSSRVMVGQKVAIGETLAVLDQGDLLAQLTKARADLKSGQIELDAKRRSAGTSFENAQSEAVTALQDAYTTSDNAVRNNADRFFKNPRDYNATFSLGTADNSISYIFDLYISFDTRAKLANMRVETETVLRNWANSMKNIAGKEALEEDFRIAEASMGKVRIFLDELALAVNSVSSYYNPTYQTEIEGYKSAASSARSAVAAAVTNLIAAKEAFNTAPGASVVGSTRLYEDVLVEEARVEALHASVLSIESNL
jgi:multidrug efflux pump subunit AcrA (membrane-fusion protein)